MSNLASLPSFKDGDDDGGETGSPTFVGIEVLPTGYIIKVENDVDEFKEVYTDFETLINALTQYLS